MTITQTTYQGLPDMTPAQLCQLPELPVLHSRCTVRPGDYAWMSDWPSSGRLVLWEIVSTAGGYIQGLAWAECPGRLDHPRSPEWVRLLDPTHVDGLGRRVANPQRPPL